MPTYRNTPEQEAIIAAIWDGRNVGVQACAGAGKSFIACALAHHACRRRPVGALSASAKAATS